MKRRFHNARNSTHGHRAVAMSMMRSALACAALSLVVLAGASLVDMTPLDARSVHAQEIGAPIRPPTYQQTGDPRSDVQRSPARPPSLGGVWYPPVPSGPLPPELQTPVGVPPTPTTNAPPMNAPPRQAHRQDLYAPSPYGTPAQGPSAAMTSPVPSPGGAPPNAATPPAPDQIEGTMLLAIVGDQHILAGDVLPAVDQILEPYFEQMRQAEDEYVRGKMQEALAKQRQMLMYKFAAGQMETKLLYQEFMRTIPADKRKEVVPKIRKQLSDEFDRTELPKLLERAKAADAADLDAKLRQWGSSLAKQRQTFTERMLGQQAVRSAIKVDPEITHQQMLDYYNEHLEEFHVTAKAKWEQLTVLYNKFPTKQAAWDALAQMGNEVYLGGAPFDAVAKRSSQGPTAASGGLWDWISQGSLKSKPIDNAVFTLPLNRLSPIIEDSEGYHIVRVLERSGGETIPFEEAQPDIKKTLKQEQLRAQINQYVETLRSKVYIWTAFELPNEKGPAVAE